MESRPYVGQQIASINHPFPSSSTLPPAPPLAVEQQFPLQQQQQQPVVGAQATVQSDPVSSNTTAPTNGTKKRRISNAGSRGVANLTPEQLAKKRANDREAQRAIRERTKGQIEKLEKKIQELTAQKPYLELQKVIRQKEKVEAENEDIKRRLLSVQSLIQPWVAGSVNDATPSHPPTPNLPPLHTANDTRSSLMQPFPLPIAPYGDIPSMRSSASNPSYVASPPIQKQGVPIPPSNFPPTPGAFSPANTSNSRHGSGQSLTSNRPPDDKLALEFLMQSRHNSGDSDQLGVRRGRAISSSSSILPMDTMNACTYGNGILDVQGNPLPVCALPIRNIPPTCPLDGLLLDFLADQRKQAINGVTPQELMGPHYPSFLSLVDPQRNQYSHPLSKVFVDMIVTFPDISTLPEQVAILYIMFLIMRYSIAPTPETYDRLPHWATPRPSQLFHPHPCWVDYLPFPRMRDRLTRSYPSIPFDEFFVPYTTTVSLNWPHGEERVLVPSGGGGGGEELGLSCEFEEHLRDLGNWTVGPAFVKAHPSLAGTVKVSEGEATGTGKGKGKGRGRRLS